MNRFFFFIYVIHASIFLLALKVYVLMKLWFMFLVPAGLPEIRPEVMIGVVLFYSILSFRGSTDFAEDSCEEIFKTKILSNVFACFLTLGIAHLIKFFY